MRFKEYVAARQVRDNPQGDFIEDARRDKRMPDVESWPELRSYLTRRGGDDDVIDAARLVWVAYCARVRALGTA